MAAKPPDQFGKRRPAVLPPQPPAKRSNHVALLVMGTLAVGGGAYALMPRENCEPSSPGMATSGTSAECTPRSSSSSGAHGSGGGGSSRSSFFSGDSSASHAASGSGDAASGVTRGGFGSFGHAFGFHGG